MASDEFHTPAFATNATGRGCVVPSDYQFRRGNRMTLSRLTAWTLLAAVGFAMLSDRFARAQDTPLPQPDRTANSALSSYKEKESPRIPDSELAAAKKHFEAFAKYYAALIAHPLVYRAAQDPSIKEDSNRQTILSIDRIL